jgi:hypothetical protein
MNQTRPLLVALLLVCAFLVGLTAAREALGAELSIQPRAGITLLGTDAPTGGVSAGINARALFTVRDAAPVIGVYAGAGADVIGLAGGWYHMGIIAGPRIGWWMQHKALFLAGGVGTLYGQLSTCRLWEAGARQCMRWWNPWPEASIEAAYRDDDMHIGLTLSSLALSTPWSTDAAFSLAATGSWR